jgi:hypothetical protein
MASSYGVKYAAILPHLHRFHFPDFISVLGGMLKHAK